VELWEFVWHVSHSALSSVHWLTRAGWLFSDAVRCGVEYISCKLLPLNVESWEFVWHESHSALSSVHWLTRVGCVFSAPVRCRVDSGLKGADKWRGMEYLHISFLLS
jgi:hypothetical protein